MNSNVIYLKLKNLAKLEKLIKANAPYEKILKQNQIVDKYVQIQLNSMIKKEVSS